MRAAILAFALTLQAVPAPAEAVRVRAGEHADFSRIVIDLPADADWRLGRRREGYGLRLSDASDGFDTATVFAKIPKTRLLAVATDARDLVLTTGAGIYATAFETSGGAVVIDLRAGNPPADSAFERALDPGALAAPVGQGYRPTPAADPHLALFWPGLDDPGASGAPAAAPPEPAPDPRVAAAESELLRQLGRAAAQGLIEVDAPGRPPRTASEGLAGPGATAAADALAAAPGDRSAGPDAGPDHAAPETTPAGTLVGEGPPTPAAFGDGDHLRFRAQTSIDRDLRPGAPREPTTGDGRACLPDAALAVETWGDDRPAAAQLAEAGARLTGEFDLADPEAVATMARLYLHFGFGAEARATLEAFGGAPDDDMLLAMAGIVDDGEARGQDPFAGMADCDSHAALWAVLATPRIPPGTDVEHAAVERAFSALPLQLRRHLGPVLSQRLLDAGAKDAARAVQDAIRRAPGDHGAGVALVGAELDRAHGRPEAAEATLAAIIAENRPESPGALVRYIDSRVDRGAAVPPDMIAAAAAFSYELQDSGEGSALARAHMLALGSAAEYSAAFAVLSDLREAKGGAAAAEPARRLFSLLAADPDDARFLAAYFAEAKGFDRAMPDVPLRLTVARRLVGLGFSEEGRVALGAAGRATADGRLIAAQAALLDLDAAGALALLEGIDGLEPDLLRGQALERQGAHRAAAEAYRGAARADLADAAAWRAGAWAEVGPAASAARRAALALGQPPAAADLPQSVPAADEPPFPRDGGASVVPAAGITLSRSRQIIEDSRKARAIWQALLAGGQD